RAGYNFGETTELLANSFEVAPAPVEPGVYRNVAGATALSWGLIAASELAGLPIYYASYPITPASELLHELSKRKNFGVRTLHAESPLPIVAAKTPSHCFDAAIEAVRIAITYRTPVILLSDTFLANSSEPWRLPDVEALPKIEPRFATAPNHDDGFMPYRRDE